MTTPLSHSPFDLGGAEDSVCLELPKVGYMRFSIFPFILTPLITDLARGGYM